MIVRVKLFAAARQRAEAEVIEVDVGEPATVADLRGAMARQFPQLTPIVRAALFAINADYASDSTAIPIHAEVACIPPVSGG
jgi:molybdopterin converting factor small subunit